MHAKQMTMLYWETLGFIIQVEATCPYTTCCNMKVRYALSWQQSYAMADIFQWENYASHTA